MPPFFTLRFVARAPDEAQANGGLPIPPTTALESVDRCAHEGKVACWNRRAEEPCEPGGSGHLPQVCRAEAPGRRVGLEKGQQGKVSACNLKID